MPGFDWNGNGKSDAFDHFMDMKVSTSDDADCIDAVDELNDDLDDANDEMDSPSISTRTSYASTSTRVTQSASFQDELKKNMRTPQAADREKMEREKSSAMWEAERAFDKIKELLLSQVKRADYETQNGVTFVWATYGINQLYLQPEWRTNDAQYQRNKETFFLFRDPNLKYEQGFCYDIKADYRREYNFFITALKELAAKENISIQTVLVTNKGIVPFPNTSTPIEGYAKLCVKATTIISVDPNYDAPSTEAQTRNATTISGDEKATQTNNNDTGVPLGKSLLVIVLVFLAFVLCFAADLGKLAMGILLIGVAILGYNILKK